jgi:pimeloyl-ACP methyl ester carboxylesterase
VYEPGVFVNEPAEALRMSWADRCRVEFTSGKLLSAFITFVRGINPDTTGKAPRILLRLILPLAMKREELTQKYLLLDETIREHREAARAGNQPSRYTGIKTPVLFLAGKDISTTASGRAAQRLSDLLPHGTLNTFPKLDHFGMEKSPVIVADAISPTFRAAVAEDTTRAR